MSFDRSRPHAECPCPFCVGDVLVGFSADGQGLVRHTSPRCAEFTEMTGSQFIFALHRFNQQVQS